MVQVIVQSVRRLALKIASYGVMHLVVAILVAFAITRDWRLALAVGVVEPLFQTVAYTIHDRVWHRIERRQTLSLPEETVEAVGARLDVMDAQEQTRSHSHHGHGHALPRSLPKSLGRTALKTVTYGAMHFTVAVSVAFALTRDIRLALAIGTLEPFVQTGFFAIHDRVWSRIEAGRTRRRTPVTA
jgi:uncharacterized membrane protein